MATLGPATTQNGMRRRSFQSIKQEEEQPAPKPATKKGHRRQLTGSISKQLRTSLHQHPLAASLIRFFKEYVWTILTSILAISLLYLLFTRAPAPKPVVMKGIQIPQKRFVPAQTSGEEWYKKPVFEEFNPFQYNPKPRSKVRVLFLHDYQTAVGTYDSFALDVYKAALEHPYVEAHIWGPNYEGYDLKKHFVKNVENQYGCGFFDVVYSSYGRAIPLGFPKGAVRYWDSPVDGAFGCGTVFVIKTGDCNLGQCPDEHYQWLGNVTVVRYGSELTEVFSYDRLAEMRRKKLAGYPNPPFQLYGHVPDSAHTTNYRPPDRWEDKTAEAKLFGKADPYYPLRVKIADAIKAGKTFIKPSENKSPMKAPDDETLMTLPPGKPSDLTDPIFDFYNANDAAFAEDLRSTKICIFDGSVQKKAIRKYAQASLTGCVIASQIPTEHEKILKEFTIELKAEWSIEQINKVLKDALADEAELKRKAAHMYAYASQHFTSMREMDLILEMVDRYRAGDRGYIATTDFASVCRDYFPRSEPDPDIMKTPHMLKTRPNWRYVPPWCTGKDFASDWLDK